MSLEKIESGQLQRIVLDGNVRVTIEAAQSESAPPLIATKNGNPPLRVGMLRQNKNIWMPQHTICAMFYVAKQFDIELFLFNTDDINFENKTINATVLEGNNKVQRVVPFPRIVDNSLFYGENGRKLALLEKDCYLIRHALNVTKQQVHDMMLEDGRFKNFLIESHTIDTFEQFLTLFDQYHRDVILKPLRGARGIGVARITFADDKYVVNIKNDKIPLTAEEFTKFYADNFTQRKHIFQEYIHSRTRQGNPFDIRVHARRGAGGKFKLSLFPRIGNAAGVVSNIASGGYSMNIGTFLRVEFGEHWRAIYDELIKFGSVFPDYYQNFFTVPIFDIGVDVGIQKRGNAYQFKIFEVNTYIDGPFFEIEDAITHFEYYRYIDQRIREGLLA